MKSYHHFGGRDGASIVLKGLLCLLFAVALACAQNQNKVALPDDGSGSNVYTAMMFIPSEGCACNFLDAYESLDEAARDGKIPVQILIVTTSEIMRGSLEARGMDSKRIFMDTRGDLFKAYHLDTMDLPFLVLARRKPQDKIIAMLRLSPVASEQKLAGRILLSVNSFP